MLRKWNAGCTQAHQLVGEGVREGFDQESIDSMLDTMLSDFDALVMGFVPNAASDPFLSRRACCPYAPGRGTGGGPDNLPGRPAGVPRRWDHAVHRRPGEGRVRDTPGVAEYMKHMMTMEVVVINTMGHFLQLVMLQAAAQ